MLTAGEAFFLFADRTVRFSIEGATPFAIDTFGTGARIEHGFQMAGDSLTGISVRFAAERSIRIRVLSVLSAPAERVPDAHAELYRWVSVVALNPGLSWKRFDFPELAGSNDRFYTFRIRLVDGVLSDDTGEGTPAEKLPVAVMASQDNPLRGGMLWIDGVRHRGSLNLRAHGPGETAYERFRDSVGTRLPPPLRHLAVQIALALAYQWALFVFADALLFGDSRRASSLVAPGMRRGHVLVVSLVPQDASTELFFTRLADRFPLSIVAYPGNIARALSDASAVIFVRGLFEFREAIWCARWLGIPRYYFVDDNFMLIRREPNRYGRLYDRYTTDRVRAKLQGFAGVLLATESLMQYFRDEGLHDRLLLFPPIGAPPLAAPASADGRPLTIAYFAGVHRRDAFVRYVFPAICRLARNTKIRLLAAGFEPGGLSPVSGIEIVYPPYDQSYVSALQRMAQHGVDILVHPSAPTENNRFKNRHVLINAYALGATAIFSNTPPYDAIGSEGVAVVCDNTEDAWHDALTRVCTDDRLRRDLHARLADYCTEHFTGDSNARVIDDVLDAHASPSTVTRIVRGLAAMSWLGGWRLLRILRRLFKRVG